MGGSNTVSHSEPRINTLRIQQSTYGAGIPIIFGTTRITGNILDYVDFTAVPHTTTQESGKGGGSTYQETTYTYYATIVLGLGEGPAAGIGQVWKDKEIISLANLGDVAVYLGDYSQLPWDHMQSTHPDHALAYRGIAYLGLPYLNLGSDASIPNLSLEFKGLCIFGGPENIPDANPKEMISVILTDPRFGAMFSADYIGDWTQYSNYCVANGLFLSAPIIEQGECREWITDILNATNSEVFWSQAILKITPYGDEETTGHGVTFTPQNQAVFELTADDILDDDPPVMLQRSDTPEAYNYQEIEIIDRANAYNTSIAKWGDQADIDSVGFRPAEPLKMHFIHDQAVGQAVARQIVQRNIHVRNRYTLRLGWEHILLDPMDIGLITEDYLGLDRATVRILEIEEIIEDDTEYLDVTVEEIPAGAHGMAQYDSQAATRAQPNYNVDPGDINTPVIFEPPASITGGNSEVLIAVAGVNPEWGGAELWVSENDATYKRVGTITNPARYGFLTTELPAGDSPDLENTLAVELVGPLNNQLLSGTQADADQLNTLCHVDGELIAYQTATLVATGQYNLTYLVRGAYGTTITSHDLGTPFVRLDDAVFKYPFRKEDVGKQVYLKFVSYNIYGGGKQKLEDVVPIVHVLSWNAPPNVENYYVMQNLRSLEHHWSYDDPTGSIVGVEIRRLSPDNPNWDAGQVVGTMIPGFRYVDNTVVTATLLFGIKAIGKNGSYSEQMETFEIPIGYVPDSNYIVALDVMASLDPAKCSGGASVENGKIVLDTVIEWDEDTVTEWDEDTVQEWGTPAALAGAYRTGPQDLGKVITSIFSPKILSYTGPAWELWWAFSETDAVLDDSADWVKFVPGSYKCRYYNFELRLTGDGDYHEVTVWQMAIDVPDMRLHYPNETMPLVEITDAVAGVRIDFPVPFIKKPKVQGTVLDSDATIYIADADLYLDHAIVRAKLGGNFVTGILHVSFFGY